MFPEEHANTLLDADLLLAFAATNDPDVMYLHEAMRKPDRKQFLAAMQRKWKVRPRMVIDPSFHASQYQKVPPYFQRYGPCVGSDESTLERSTSGRPGSTLTAGNKQRASITGKRILRWQHGHPSDSSWCRLYYKDGIQDKSTTSKHTHKPTSKSISTCRSPRDLRLKVKR
jgi:hypothetical protein